MHWILQDNMFHEDGWQRLREALERFGVSYSVHKIVPFIGQLIPEPPKIEGPVMCMGSYSMRHTAKREGWFPGVFDLEPYDFTVQRGYWGNHMLNADSEVYEFHEAEWPVITACSAHRGFAPGCDICENTVHDLAEVFIRPIEDSKSFSGKIFTKDEFLEWQHKVCKLEEDYGGGLHKNSLIQMAFPKTIYAEYRFWIIKGQIVCASLYKRGQTVIHSDEVPDHIHHFVRERVLEWQPLDAFVIDVAEVPNLDAVRWSHGDQDKPHWLKIVEINTINSSGFYACDMQKLVMAFEEAFN